MDVGSSACASRNLVQVLIHRAAMQPLGTAYHFINDLPAIHIKLSYAALLHEAASLAVVLQRLGLAGKPVLLACKTNCAFVIGLYACLMSGALAVPTAPPRRDTLRQRIDFIAEHSEAAGVLTDSESVLAIRFAPALEKIAIRCGAASVQGADPALWEPATLHDDSPALIQYTSGTTGDPHGVLQTHGRLARACAAIQQSFSHDERSVSLITLPLHHELGLAYGVLEPMMTGMPAILMTPAQYVQRPRRWLYLIQSHRVTTIGGPNFMFDILLRSVHAYDLHGVDLSSLRTCFCTGETVRASTMSRLLDLLGPAGLRAEVLVPCYSLSETARHVTGACTGKAPLMDEPGIAGATHPVMSCGAPHADCRLLIVDSISRCEAAEGEAGEIWLRSDSAGTAYWKEAQTSEAVFQACLENGDGPYLRTGDLGYLLAGELYVLGRLSERIRLNGADHAPQDLELLAERSHPGVRPSSSAAFIVDGMESPRLVIVCELKRELMRRREKWPGIEMSIRNALRRVHGLAVEEVVLLASGAMPKTSSGKVRRNQCRSDYLDGTLATAELHVAMRAQKAERWEEQRRHDDH